MRARPTLTIGVSLKMYMGAAETVRWTRRLVELASGRPAVSSGIVEIFVLPTMPLVIPVAHLLARSGIGFGAQDLSSEDSGAFTGDVSGAVLREIGCTYAEVGHAERRRHHGEDLAIVAAKAAAAFRNGLTPVLCVGEHDRSDIGSAAAATVIELASIVDAIPPDLLSPLVVAYEPHWAIGAVEPAPPEHVVGVVEAINSWIAGVDPLHGSAVIYGGSAGPGTLSQLVPAVRGLFLGRFAHDPLAFAAVLQEASALAEAEAANA